MNTVMTVAEPLPPMVSVIIANHNGGAFIEDALASAARQTVRHIEIIVVDDVSTDDSTARVEAFAARDPRVSLIRMTQRTGPGAARNQALRVARGTWIAVLDSDDLMHPRRLAELVEAGTSDGVELVADNQLVFDHARVVPARPLLDRNALPIDGMIDIADYVVSNRFFSRAMPLGYLKPLFLRSFLERTGCRYDPTLLIAEDYDLVLRLLLSGARFRVLPQMTYFYRRHSQSISHRLSEATLLPMLAADTALRTAASSFPALTGSVAEALDVRRETIVRALGFEALVAAIKARDWGGALRIGCRRPSVASLLRVPVADRLRRLLRRRPSRVGAASSGPRVSLVSRQRIVGPTNGSSAYLLALCESLKQAGYEIDLVSPSPAMFGRWPALRLDPVMDVFASIRIRDSIRIGRVIVARDPRIALRAAGEVVHRLLARLHVRVDALSRKAPHAIAVPWTDADRIFVVDAIHRSSAILTDYAFLNEAIPFALQPRVPSAVVMHDLFFTQDPTRTVVLLDREAEITLLDQADAVIAIQDEEGGAVRRLLPGKPVILAPMAVTPVLAPQPGADGTILFVGSNTQPNIDGITWFLDEVWPHVLERHPAARLQVAGACCGSLSGSVRNLTLLGRVEDLDGFYCKAGVVISPLRLGSGLKIKLVEALGRGKAVIATETTLQGVKTLVQDVVRQADMVDEFIETLGMLLYDTPARTALGAAALDVARRYFSPAACFGGVLDFIGSGDRPSHPPPNQPVRFSDPLASEKAPAE